MRKMIWALLITGASFAPVNGDIIVDRTGNEIICTVDSIGRDRVHYRDDTAASAASSTISRRDVFMIKYNDGRKLVIGGGVAGPAETGDSTRRVYCAVMGNAGVFGLFNVDWTLTPSLYSAGMTPYVEMRFARHFAAGVECIVLWGKPSSPDKPRLLIDPGIRFKALFPVLSRIRVEPLIAAGVSWWPKVSGSPSLDSTFLDNRFGWNARAALGFDYAITPRFSIMLEAGYSASSSESRGIWITHDMMLVSIGPKVSF